MKKILMLVILASSICLVARESEVKNKKIETSTNISIKDGQYNAVVKEGFFASLFDKKIAKVGLYTIVLKEAKVNEDAPVLPKDAQAKDFNLKQNIKIETGKYDAILGTTTPSSKNMINLGKVYGENLILNRISKED